MNVHCVQAFPLGHVVGKMSVRDSRKALGNSFMPPVRASQLMSALLTHSCKAIYPWAPLPSCIAAHMQMSEWIGEHLLSYDYNGSLPAHVMNALPANNKLQQPDYSEEHPKSVTSERTLPSRSSPKYFYWCQHENVVREVKMMDPPFLVRIFFLLHCMVDLPSHVLVSLTGISSWMVWCRFFIAHDLHAEANDISPAASSAEQVAAGPHPWNAPGICNIPQLDEAQAHHRVRAPAAQARLRGFAEHGWI
jgi:hypothetical protein